MQNTGCFKINIDSGPGLIQTYFKASGVQKDLMGAQDWCQALMKVMPIFHSWGPIEALWGLRSL